MKVIVAAREAALRADLQKRIKRSGFEVRAYSDAESAWRGFCDERPALAVLGWTDGALDGLELCRRMRDDPRAAPLAIWIVTNRNSPTDRAAVIAAGADDMLVLPLADQWSEVRIAAIERQTCAARQMLDIERALSESNERFDLAVRGSNEGLWDARPLPGIHWNSPENPVWYSERMKELMGFEPDEFPNVLGSWSARLNPEDAPRVLQALNDHIDRRKPYDVEYRLRMKDGKDRWFSAKGQAIWGPNGEFLRMAGSLRDTTEARLTADALRASEEQWRGLVQHAPDIITVTSLDGTIKFINRTNAVGHTVEQLIGMCIYDFVRPDEVAEIRTIFNEVIATGEPCRLEREITNRDGSITWYSSRIGPIVGQHGVEALVIISTDVTDRKLAEESRLKFFALVENSGDFIGMLNPAGDIEYLNPAGCALVGLKDLTDAKGVSLVDLYTDACRRQFLDAAIPAVLSEGQWAGELQFVHRETGRVIDVQQKIFQMPGPRPGSPICLATITRDTTERTRYEHDLRREQELLRRLLDLQERERQLVAYEIHDGMVQEMTAALMHLDAFHHHAGYQGSDDDFDRGRRLLRMAVDEARRLISGLRPPVLDELGIVAAIEYLINEARPEIPDIEFEHATTFERLAPPLESAVFRIVQEALSNVRKHSRSRTARIELTEQDQRLKVEVRDWGRGFDPDKVSGERFGLQGIRQRARLLGSTAEIDSRPGGGTVIRVELPLIRDHGGEKSHAVAPPN